MRVVNKKYFYLAHRPRRVIREMAWQHADAEFTLAIEVEEALGAVDVVEG